VEIGITIYFVAFKSKFEDQMIPKLQNAVQNTYEGPNKLLTGSADKPSAVSIAWDFIMYNVSYFPKEISIKNVVFSFSFNVVVFIMEVILLMQQNGIEQIHGGIQPRVIRLNIFNIQSHVVMWGPFQRIGMTYHLASYNQLLLVLSMELIYIQR
jgi:hypothetical protein